MKKYHVPVLLSEVIDLLNIKNGHTYVDATLGGGGHTLAILKRLRELGGGRLLSIDQDPEALLEAGRVIKDSGVLEGQAGQKVSFSVLQGNFSDLKEILAQVGVVSIDGILMDLGVSSHQLDAPWRGFSFKNNGKLDMRMANSNSETISAADLVNGASCEELKNIISRWGEERYAGRIAAAIVRERTVKPIETTFELANLISRTVPNPTKSSNPKGRIIHPATRTFQALRIAVNDELFVLERGVASALELLNHGGRAVIISYHSLEDRIVKSAFKSGLGRCVCPPLAPICTCGAKAVLREITKKPLLPSDDELKDNPRSRSAKLRAAERI
ncbi:MAG: 16S rRNA (cytosine(1402)-N(4))-methyltransferase RsmH [Candidatus Bruticola sp.]